MLRSCQLSQWETHRSTREHFHMYHNSKLDAVLKYLFKSPFRPLWAPQASQGVYPSPERGPRGQLRWRWWLFPATVSGPPWFNRHFLVQWTAWWVVKTPMLPAVASPSSIAECWCAVMAVVSTTRSDAHTNLPTSTPTPLTSVHPCVSERNTNGFPLGPNGMRLPFQSTLFLTALASLAADCPHGYSCSSIILASANTTAEL